MKAIILAGGYAKRMWPLTKDTPKSLLPITDRPAIDFIVDTIRSADVRDIVISTNQRFSDQFQNWLTRSKLRNIEIIVEPSDSEKNKLGAVRALAELRKGLSSDDYLVMAGDNIITANLRGMISFYHSVNSTVVGVFEPLNQSQLQMGAVVVLDHNKRIKEFEEKPKQARGRLGALIYILPFSTFLRIDEYLGEGLNADAPGHFIAWLYEKEAVYGYTLGGHVMDIGNPTELARAREELRERV